MNEEQLKQSLRKLGQMAGKSLTEEQINQMVGNILGGTQRSPIAASFNVQNITDIAKQVGEALGINKTQEQLQPLIQQQQQMIGQLGQERESVRQALEQRRETAVGMARDDLASYQNQLLSKLGLSLGVASGQVELVDSMLRKARMEVQNLMTQYDTAIAQSNWEMASQIEQRMANLVNLVRQVTQQDIANLANIFSSAIQFPLFQQSFTQNQLQFIQQTYEPLLKGITETGAKITPQTQKILDSYTQSLANVLGQDQQWAKRLSEGLRQVLSGYRNIPASFQIVSDKDGKTAKAVVITKQGQIQIHNIPGLATGTLNTNELEKFVQSLQEAFIGSQK
jgi:hypothetical protein